MLKKDKHEGFFGGLYKRNETFLMLSTMIFLVSMFVGYAFSGVLDQVLGSVLGDLKRRLTEGELKLTTFSIFANNLHVAFLIYVGGLIVGFFTVFYLIVNGAFLGYAAAKYPLGDFVIFTIPHGIPEIIGIIISGAAGFRLASCVIHILKDITHIRSDISFIGQFKYILEIHADEFVESLKLFGIAVVFLIVAAFIEANLSIPWGRYIQGVL